MDLQDAFYVRPYDIDGYVLDEDFDFEDDYDYEEDYEAEFVDVLYSYVDAGFLALRYLPIPGDETIIAEIYQNGTTLLMTGEYSGNYGYCYVPDFDMYGWVDVRYTF